MYKNRTKYAKLSTNKMITLNNVGIILNWPEKTEIINHTVSLTMS